MLEIQEIWRSWKLKLKNHEKLDISSSFARIWMLHVNSGKWRSLIAFLTAVLLPYSPVEVGPKRFRSVSFSRAGIRLPLFVQELWIPSWPLSTARAMRWMTMEIIWTGIWEKISCENLMRTPDFCEFGSGREEDFLLGPIVWYNFTIPHQLGCDFCCADCMSGGIKICSVLCQGSLQTKTIYTSYALIGASLARGSGFSL